MQRFDRILVPLDSSELSERALDVALTLARAFDSHVLLLGVRGVAASLEPGKTEAAISSIESEIEGLLRQADRSRIENGVAEDHVRGEVRAGDVAGAIVEAAQEHMVDLIVMGTHGRKGLSDLFTGSTTERVAARTSASLMVVKPEGFPYLRD